MANIIIMYHFVGDDYYLKSFTTAKFRDQLKYLVNRYKIITLSQYLDDQFTEDTCILTFDDGLKGGYINCLPILEEFGAKAVFFIPTSILIKRRVLSAHKRTLLLAKLGVRQLVDEFNQLFPEYLRIYEHSKAVDEYNDPLTSNLKYMLDYMDHTTSEDFTDTIFRRYFDEEEEYGKMYLTVKEIMDLKRRGMDIGTHGHNHRWLGNLYFKDQYEDLKNSVDTFKFIFDAHPRFMSYPFGSQNFITHRLLSHCGFEAGLLDPTSAVKDPSPFEMNRYDCIDIGKDRDGVPGLLKRVSRR